MDNNFYCVLCINSESKEESLLSVLSVAGVLCDYKTANNFSQLENILELNPPKAIIIGNEEQNISFIKIVNLLQVRNLNIPLIYWQESQNENLFFEVIDAGQNNLLLKKITNLKLFWNQIADELTEQDAESSLINLLETGAIGSPENETNMLLETNARLQHEVKVRLKVENELRRTELFLSAVVEQLPNLVFVKEAKTLKYSFINKSVTDLLGYTKEDIIGKTVADIFSKELSDYLIKKDQELLITRQNIEIEEDIFITKDNRIRILNTRKILIKGLDGSPSYILDLADDVTDKIRNENELKRVDKRLAKLFQSIPVGIVVVRETDLEITDVNPSFLNLIGLSQNEVIYKSLSALEVYSDNNKVVDLIENAKSAGKNQSSEISMISAGRKPVTVFVSVEFLNYEGDDPMFILMFLDITERKQAEEDMQRALASERELNILKTRFISMISHEFRTPLTSIMLSTDLLKRYSVSWDEGERSKHFNRIQNTVLTMTKLMENVLIIGRLESGKFELNKEVIDINSYCKSLAENIEENYQHEKQIVFVSHCEDQAFALDENLLGLILTNLLTNAMKYSYKDGHIQLEISAERSAFVFKIIDYGVGIPDQDKDHIFETFHRGSNTASIPGYGLGLSIVRKCIEVHQGSIEFESEEGKGSIFTVRLPAV